MGEPGVGMGLEVQVEVGGKLLLCRCRFGGWREWWRTGGREEMVGDL